MVRNIIVSLICLILGSVIGFLQFGVLFGYEAWRKAKGYCQTVLNDEAAYGSFATIVGIVIWLFIMTSILY